MKAFEFLRRRQWLLTLVIVALVALPAYLRMEDIASDNQDTAECVRAWAKGQSERSIALADASASRFDAISAIVNAVSQNDEDAMRNAVESYRRADSDYRDVGRQHPAENLRC